MSGGFPDGIAEKHAKGAGVLPRQLRWLAFGVLAIILAIALLGTFGGADDPIRRVEGQAASLIVEAPVVLRNGELFEMHVTGEARRALAKPTIAVSSTYWRDLTINTMIPAPASEDYDSGYFVFEFDPLEAGQSIELKIDGQVNPAMFAGTRGVIAFRDGNVVLAEMPVRLTVFP